jgi:hypothetical protein
MKGTRFKPIVRECLGTLKREIKIACTPVPKDKTWVFLVGCYNSGTTLLAELLSRHDSISALPTEGHFITDQFVKDYDIGVPRMWVNREDLFYLDENSEGPDPIRLKKEWAIRLDLGKPLLLEKSPPNSAKTRWLQNYFENAHFIGIVRNPYAVSEGICRKAEPHHLVNGWPIDMCAYQWKRSNEVLRNDSKYLKKFMWLKYEDLVENTQVCLNHITEFLQIEKLEFIDSGQTWAIHERNDEIRNMNSVSIEKLSRGDIAVINSVAGDSIESFGYKRL